MGDLILTNGHIRAGVWEAVLTGTDIPPALEVTHQERPLPGVTLTARPEGGFVLRVPVPVDAVSDGVQTFLIRDPAGPRVIGHFTIIAGVAADHDLRAEIDLIRAELDMLKRAFRRSATGE